MQRTFALLTTVCVAVMCSGSAVPAGEHRQQAQQGGRDSAIQQQQRAERQPARVKVSVPEDLKEAIAGRGFAVTPQRYQDRLAPMYRMWKSQHYPVVVTSDAVLHTAHLVFDWHLRFLETVHLRDHVVFRGAIGRSDPHRLCRRTRV